MLKVHFSNSKIVTDTTLLINLLMKNYEKAKWIVAKNIVMHDRVFWTIMSFKLFNPGMNRIFPALLQKSSKIFALILCRIFMACIA